MRVDRGACVFCFFKQKTAYEMRISDWSSDVCSSDLASAPECECRPRRQIGDVACNEAVERTTGRRQVQLRLVAMAEPRSHTAVADNAVRVVAARARVAQVGGSTRQARAQDRESGRRTQSLRAGLPAPRSTRCAARTAELGAPDRSRTSTERSEEHTSELQSLMRIP